VLICQGYAPNQQKRVHIYGTARVTGDFRVDPPHHWNWRFVHPAAIQVSEVDVPKEELASAIQLDSLRRTLHHIDRQKFENAVDLIRSYE